MADATSRTVPLLLAALGLAGLVTLALWLRSSAESLPATAADQPGEGVDVSSPAASAPAATTSRRAADASTPDSGSRTAAVQQPAPRAMGQVLIRAIRNDDEAVVPEFRWALETPDVDAAATGTAQGGFAYVPVPLGQLAMLRVTADGFLPSLAVDASLQNGAATREVVARLVPRLTGPSAVLTVLDDLERPIAHVQLTVEREDRAGRGPAEWHTVQRFESHADHGDHALVDLDPARYRVRMVALQDDGRPALWIPVTEAFRFSGSQQVERSVRLAPAGSVVLELRDGDGFRGPDTEIHLIDSAGRRRRVAWRAVDGDPSAPATGTLPAAEPCELAEPVLPGSYQLQVTGPGLETTLPVTVWVGQRTPIRLP